MRPPSVSRNIENFGRQAWEVQLSIQASFNGIVTTARRFRDYTVVLGPLIRYRETDKASTKLHKRNLGSGLCPRDGGFSFAQVRGRSIYTLDIPVFGELERGVREGSWQHQVDLHGRRRDLAVADQDGASDP